MCMACEMRDLEDAIRKEIGRLAAGGEIDAGFTGELLGRSVSLLHEGSTLLCTIGRVVRREAQLVEDDLPAPGEHLH